MPTTVEDSAKVVGRFKSSFSSEHELTLFVELEARVTRLERDRELLVESIEKLTCRLEAVAANLCDTENTACNHNQHQRFLDQGGSPSNFYTLKHSMKQTMWNLG